MATTIQIKGEVSFEQIQMAIRVLKALGLKVEVEKKDPTKMTKEEFFTMVDEAREEKGVDTSIESLKRRYL